MNENQIITQAPAGPLVGYNSSEAVEINLTALPLEIIRHIFSHLECKNLLNTSLLSKELREIANSPILWKNLVQEINPRLMLPQSLEKPVQYWQKKYGYEKLNHPFEYRIRIKNNEMSATYKFKLEIIWNRSNRSISTKDYVVNEGAVLTHPFPEENKITLNGEYREDNRNEEVLLGSIKICKSNLPLMVKCEITSTGSKIKSEDFKRISPIEPEIEELCIVLSSTRGSIQSQYAQNGGPEKILAI